MFDCIFGYSQEALIKHNLTVNDACFIQWFSSIHKRRQLHNEWFFQIKYNDLVVQLPIIFKNIYTVRRFMHKNSSENPEDKTLLIRKFIHTKENGVETYFRLNPIIYDELINGVAICG